MSNQILISSGAKLRDLDDVIIGTDGVLSSLGFNVANGVPKLDENGKILVSQLPNSVMEFKGVWNAATNTPTLVDGTGNAGDVYLCNVAGTVNFGTGPITFAVGDYAVYTGTVWARSSGATGTVTSVAVSKDGDALAITGSPITTSGTINIGFAGTNLQYINGAGNLVTFPDLTVYVPTSRTLTINDVTYDLSANRTWTIDSMIYPEEGIAVSTGTAWGDSIVDNSSNWNTAYNNSIVSAEVTGTTTKTLTLDQQDGGTITASWTDYDTAPVTSVFGRTGAVVAVSGDYTTAQVTESGNLYFTDARARAAISLTTLGTSGAATYNNTTGVLNIPNYTTDLTGYVPYTGATTNVNLGVHSLSAYDLIINHTSGSGVAASITKGGNGEALTVVKSSGSGNAASITGGVTLLSELHLTTDLADAYIASAATWNAKQNAITLTTTGSSGASTFISNTLNVPNYTLAGLGGQPLATNLTSLSGLTYASTSFVKMTAAGTFALDTNTYALASALSGYLPLTGGIVTGALSNVTSAASTTFLVENTNAAGFSRLTLKNTERDFFITNNTTDDLVSFAYGASNRLQFDATNQWFNTGSLGIGGTLLSWLAGYSVIQMPQVSIFSGAGGGGLFFGNAYLNSAGVFTYQNSSLAASLYNNQGGAHQWSIAPSGTAGNPITFTQAMTLNSSGNLALGSTSPSWSLFKAINIFGGSFSSASGGGVIIARNWYYESGEKYFADGTAQRMELVGNGFFFQTAANNTSGAGATLTWSSPMTLTSTGNLLLNTTTDAGFRLDVSGTTRFSGISTFTGTTVAANGSVNIDSADPALRFRVTGGVANSRIFEWRAINNLLELRLWNDAQTSVTPLFNILSSGYANFNDAVGIRTNNFGKGARLNILNGPSNTNAIDIKNESYTTSAHWGTFADNTYFSQNYYFNGSQNADNSAYGQVAIVMSTSTTVGQTTIDFNLSNPGSTSPANRLRLFSSGIMQLGAAVSGGGALQVQGNVNINGVFQINGVTIGGGGGSGVTGSGTTNYLTKWTGSSTLGNSGVTDDGSTIRATTQFVQGPGAARSTSGTTIALTLAGATYSANSDPGDGGRFLSIVNDSSATNAFSALSYRVNPSGGTNNAMLDVKFVNTNSQSGTLYWTFLTPGGFQDRMALNSAGNLLLGTNTDNGYRLNLNGSISYAYGFLNNFRGSSGAGDVLVGNDGSRFYIGGNTYVSGSITSTSSVTATGGFFDTSDARLKTLVEDNYLLSSIANVKAKLYIKNGRKELGYYAQDLESILPSAVSEGSDGFLSLSYAQVHTAKIAVIEDEVTILKNRVSELESKLQKYQA